MPKIILESLTEPEKVWKFGERDFPITIGRAGDNQVVIAMEFVSKYHAEIRQAGQDYILNDSGSRNGTYLNGKRIGKGEHLKTGNRIGISAYLLEFRMEHSGTAQLTNSQTAPIKTEKQD